MALRTRLLSSARHRVTQQRRNRVFRFAALYAAAAFIALQVADVAFQPLGVPEVVTKLLIVASIVGFPIVVLLAWMLDDTPEATRWTSLSTAGTTTVEPLSPSRIAVIPFAVRGSEEHAYLAEGLVDLLSSKVCCAGDLRHVDPHALISYAKHVQRKRPDPESGRRIAERFGAGLFILGNVLEAGGRLHIDATIYRCIEGVDVVTRANVEGEAAQLFELVDDLARQLLTGLTAESGARLTRLAVTTTESVEALGAYLMGESEMRAMRRIPAVAAFQRAVEADPTFALAWYRLGMAALWSGQLELSRDAAERANVLADRLTGHDRLLVQAFWAFLRGETEEAERLYRTIVGNQPDDVEAWYQLAEVLFHYRPRLGGSVLESRTAWERVLQLEPEHVSALVHMALIAACEGKDEEVASLVARALQISPDGDAATWMMALRAWVQGDAVSQKRALDKLRRSSDFSTARGAWYVGVPARNLDGAKALSGLLTDDTRSAEARALGYVWLTHLELVQGRWDAAQGHLASLESIDPASGVIYRSMLALLPFVEVERSDLQALRERLSRLDCESRPQAITAGAYFNVHERLHAQLRTYLQGVIAAQLGDSSEALRFAEQLHNLEGRPEAVELARDQALGIRARVRMNEGDDAGALEILESARMRALFELTIASPFYSQALERFLRAELLSRLDRPDEARRWYGSFQAHSIYDLVFLPTSHLRRAELLEEQGEYARAVSHYRRFSDFWRGADSQFAAAVESSERRLEELTSEVVGKPA